MKVKNILLLGTSLLLLLSSNVNAYTEEPLIENNENYTKSINANLSEEDEVVELLNHDIKIGSNKYKVVGIEKTENKVEIKEVTKEKKETLSTNNQEYIKKYFGELYKYEDEEYEGNIPITHININRIDYGQYQELREKKIEFKNYSKNDLNNVKKEITDNGITYYLIKVDWEMDEIEIIDNKEVPKSYKGTMTYQTVVTLNNPYKYEITVTYSGKVEKKNKDYKYTALYLKEEPGEIIEEERDIVPTIIISGTGLGVITLLFLLTNKNTRIYNRTESGYKLLGKFKLASEGKNIIDITKYNHKINSNMYCLKMNNSIYKKIKGKIVYIKIENISKPITINSKYIEFII